MSIQTLVGIVAILGFGALCLLWMILLRLTEIKTELRNVEFHTRRIPADLDDDD
jgi:hypothetical protein